MNFSIKLTLLVTLTTLILFGLSGCDTLIRDGKPRIVNVTFDTATSQATILAVAGSDYLKSYSLETWIMDSQGKKITGAISGANRKEIFNVYYGSNIDLAKEKVYFKAYVYANSGGYAIRVYSVENGISKEEPYQ